MEEKEEAEEMRRGRPRGRRKVALMHWGWGCCVCWWSRCSPGWWGWCHLSSPSAPLLAPPYPWEDNAPQRLQRSRERSGPSGALSRRGPSLGLSGRRSSIAGKAKRRETKATFAWEWKKSNPTQRVDGRAERRQAFMLGGSCTSHHAVPTRHIHSKPKSSFR